MRLLCLGLMLGLLAGCAGRAELLPNADLPYRTSAEFAADAAKRFPYKASATRGGQALAAAEVGYFLDRLDINNLSDVEWTDVECWVNGGYVVYLPKLPPKKIVSVPFQAIFNDAGSSFPTHRGSWYNPHPLMIDKVELFRDGKLYDVPVRAAE